jgi:hypothetical protein
MTELDDIDKYLDKIDDREIVGDENETKLGWTRKDHARNLLIRSAQLVKFMALPTPDLIIKKQIEMLRDRLNQLERILLEE